MGLIRDIPFPVVALEDTLIGTCSAAFLESTAAFSTVSLGLIGAKTTAGVLHTTGDIGDINHTCQGARVSSGGMVTSTQGRIIDRLRQPLGAHYQAVAVTATLTSTRGSSNADNKCAVGVTLFAGDSSGGGDLAELSTAMRPADRQFGSSARTSAMTIWDTAESSGQLNAVSHPGIYDLRNAGRYIQVRPRFGINAVTTESSSLEGARAGALAVFFAGDLLPPVLDTTSPMATSTEA